MGLGFLDQGTGFLGVVLLLGALRNAKVI